MAALYPADPAPSDRAVEVHAGLTAFMRDHVFPAEPVYRRHRELRGPQDDSVPPARALCHRAAHLIDTEGNKAARHLVSEAKVAVPRAVLDVIDRAVQVHGGAGVSDDTPLAEMWGWHRAMRIFDGRDDVHLLTLARAERNREPTFRPAR